MMECPLCYTRHPHGDYLACQKAQAAHWNRAWSKCREESRELRAAVREWAEAFRDFHDALYEFQLITTHVGEPVGLAGEEEWQRAATRERKASERMDRADSHLMELAEKMKD